MSTLTSMIGPLDDTRGVSASGLMPRTARSTPAGCGSSISIVEALAVVPRTVTGIKFIAGVPMNPATNRLTG